MPPYYEYWFTCYNWFDYVWCALVRHCIPPHCYSTMLIFVCQLYFYNFLNYRLLSCSLFFYVPKRKKHLSSGASPRNDICTNI